MSLVLATKGRAINSGISYATIGYISRIIGSTIVTEISNYIIRLQSAIQKVLRLSSHV